ncbi:MAG: tRNA-dihydrouridine synthase [Clostridiales bacterium]|jgi:tRNA-dihydrouridine synthase B|nr:tRNA-dihydrouridine synthase [Clostridiales bacterium]
MSLVIGNLPLKSRVLLAPMAGVSDLAFRLIVRKYAGVGLACTEMISARALHYNNKKTQEALVTTPADSPLSVQIFGSEPDIMREAAEKVSGIADIIDINMGCPAKKIVKNGDGGALMLNLPLAQEIIKAVITGAGGKPVTIKMRLGWDYDNLNAVTFAKSAQYYGAAAVVIHGRTVKQAYTGNADWSLIREVAKSVDIPVVGNGSPYPENLLQLCDDFGVAGVMVGRPALGNPTLDGVINFEAAHEHLTLIERYRPAKTGILESRKHIIWYLKRAHAPSNLRNAAALAVNFDEMRRILDDARDISNLGC